MNNGLTHDFHFSFFILHSMNGLVVKNTGSWYQVKTDDGRFVECKIKGNFRLKDIKSTNPIAVGDWVSIDENEGGTALINTIGDRKNYIIRRASNLSKQSHIIAANLDQALLIATVNYPVTTTTFIDRFLASAQAYRIPVGLVFNKVDRYTDDDLEYLDALIHLYETIGYPCHKISAKDDTDFSMLENLLKDKVTLLSGHSGVGKSTLINRILPDACLKTGDISEYHNKGMHTTTFSEMLELPFGGYIIDTPGIKGFGMIDMEDAEVSHYFPEIFKTAGKCRFNNCTHRREPGCAVLAAVENQTISRSRYNSYLGILEDRENGKYREAF
jgi:ribosome biogenesis GTPase